MQTLVAGWVELTPLQVGVQAQRVGVRNRLILLEDGADSQTVGVRRLVTLVQRGVFIKLFLYRCLVCVIVILSREHASQGRRSVRLCVLINIKSAMNEFVK